MDYVAKSGELKFGPGLKVRTEQIAIMDDAIDEGEETFRFRLPNAGLARIGHGPAVGTIQNNDPLQQAWLSRFRRTVGNHVTSGASGFSYSLVGASSGASSPHGRSEIDGTPSAVANLNRLQQRMRQIRSTSVFMEVSFFSKQKLGCLSLAMVQGDRYSCRIRPHLF